MVHDRAARRRPRPPRRRSPARSRPRAAPVGPGAAARRPPDRPGPRPAPETGGYRRPARPSRRRPSAPQPARTDIGGHGRQSYQRRRLRSRRPGATPAQPRTLAGRDGLAVVSPRCAPSALMAPSVSVRRPTCAPPPSGTRARRRSRAHVARLHALAAPAARSSGGDPHTGRRDRQRGGRRLLVAPSQQVGDELVRDRAAPDLAGASRSASMSVSPARSMSPVWASARATSSRCWARRSGIMRGEAGRVDRLVGLHRPAPLAHLDVGRDPVEQPRWSVRSWSRSSCRRHRAAWPPPRRRPSRSRTVAAVAQPGRRHGALQQQRSRRPTGAPGWRLDRRRGAIWWAMLTLISSAVRNRPSAARASGHPGGGQAGQQLVAGAAGRP